MRSWTRSKLPDEVEVRQPSAEYIAAAAAALAAPAEPLEPEAPSRDAVDVQLAAEGEAADEPEPLPLDEVDLTAAKARKSKVATKRLKKVAKEVKELDVDAEINTDGGDGS